MLVPFLFDLFDSPRAFKSPALASQCLRLLRLSGLFTFLDMSFLMWAAIACDVYRVVFEMWIPSEILQISYLLN